MLQCGTYRYYFHVGNIGFKFPRIDLRKTTNNKFCVFLCGIICNILERKRYKYYVLKKPIKYNGKKIIYKGVKPILVPVYFSCGLFSIVKHIPFEINKDWFYKKKENYWWKKTAYLCLNDSKPENFRKDKLSKIYCIDYGEFVLGACTRSSVGYIDYK